MKKRNLWQRGLAGLLIVGIGVPLPELAHAGGASSGVPIVGGDQNKGGTQTDSSGKQSGSQSATQNAGQSSSQNSSQSGQQSSNQSGSQSGKSGTQSSSQESKQSSSQSGTQQSTSKVALPVDPAHSGNQQSGSQQSGNQSGSQGQSSQDSSKSSGTQKAATSDPVQSGGKVVVDPGAGQSAQQGSTKQNSNQSQSNQGQISPYPQYPSYGGQSNQGSSQSYNGADGGYYQGGQYQQQGDGHGSDNGAPLANGAYSSECQDLIANAPVFCQATTREKRERALEACQESFDAYYKAAKIHYANGRAARKDVHKGIEEIIEEIDNDDDMTSAEKDDAKRKIRESKMMAVEERNNYAEAEFMACAQNSTHAVNAAGVQIAYKLGLRAREEKQLNQCIEYYSYPPNAQSNIDQISQRGVSSEISKFKKAQELLKKCQQYDKESKATGGWLSRNKGWIIGGIITVGVLAALCFIAKVGPCKKDKKKKKKKKKHKKDDEESSSGGEETTSGGEETTSTSTGGDTTTSTGGDTGSTTTTSGDTGSTTTTGGDTTGSTTTTGGDTGSTTTTSTGGTTTTSTGGSSTTTASTTSGDVEPPTDDFSGDAGGHVERTGVSKKTYKLIK